MKWRVIAGGAIAIAGVIAALLIGAPLTAVLTALLAGFFATLVGRGLEDAEVVPPAARPSPPVSNDPSVAHVLDAVEEPILILRERRILNANQAARTILGDALEGKDVRLTIRHPAAAELLGSERANDTSPTRIELVGLGDLDRRWEMAVHPLPNGGLLVHLSDRSALHAAEQMRTDFVANASHELRTPLATLVGFLETLQDPTAANDEPNRTRFLSIMFDEARRMQQLIEDLISLSRIEAERFTLPDELVDLPPLVEDVRISCRHLIEQKGSRILVRDRSSGARVYGDRVQLLQLLRNLIVNALKYGRGGEDIVVGFDDAPANMLLLRVIDKGDGIAPEHLPRLTQRFYRVDPGRSRAAGGTGLGLAIVKHIVSRHRGRLNIASTPGSGTTISVFLPAPDGLSSKSHGSVTEDSSSGHSGTARKP